jgi:hypothetical protein
MSTANAAPVSVTAWGELRGERKLPGAPLRVLVADQSAGGIERHGTRGQQPGTRA